MMLKLLKKCFTELIRWKTQRLSKGFSDVFAHFIKCPNVFALCSLIFSQPFVYIPKSDDNQYKVLKSGRKIHDKGKSFPLRRSDSEMQKGWLIDVKT